MLEIDWLVLGKDRKSTRLNSSHDQISYAVFCLKKKITPQLETNLVRIALTLRSRKPFSVGEDNSTRRSSCIRCPSRPASDYTRSAQPSNHLETHSAVPL